MNSSQLRGYLTGLILGDGTLGKGVVKRSFEIKSINKDFIDKIYDDLSSCTNFNIRIKYNEPSCRDGVSRKEFWTLTIFAHPYFNKKYNYFYNDTRRRIITRQSLHWLTPNGIANWYMSDGYITHVGKNSGNITSRRVDICTDRYTKNDVEKISKYFNEILGIRTSLNKRGDAYRLRIAINNSDKFFMLIYPYITQSFMYKLNLKYNFQPHWMCDEYYDLMSKIEKCEHPNE